MLIYLHHHRVNLKYIIKFNVYMLISKLYKYSIPKLQPSTYCLLTPNLDLNELEWCLLSSNVYSNLLICQHDINLNIGIFPKPKKVMLGYNPQPTLRISTHCFFIPLFTQLNLYLNLWICQYYIT